VVQVVALVDSSHRQARFARSLSWAFRNAGFDLRLASHRQLVAEVTVSQSVGEESSVDPDRPLLWLSPGGPVRSTTPEDRFLAAEVSAAARSIAYVTRSQVMNRPSAVSPCGSFPGSSAVAVRRIRQHGLSGMAIRAERFTASRPVDGDIGEFEVYDYCLGRSSWGVAPDAEGPYRRRKAVRSAGLVKVRVIGDRTITTTSVDPSTLETSVRIASVYDLDMAVVWWLIDDSGPTLARIDCWPWDAGFDADFDEAAEATVAWMGARLSSASHVG